MPPRGCQNARPRQCTLGAGRHRHHEDARGMPSPDDRLWPRVRSRARAPTRPACGRALARYRRTARDATPAIRRRRHPLDHHARCGAAFAGRGGSRRTDHPARHRRDHGAPPLRAVRASAQHLAPPVRARRGRHRGHRRDARARRPRDARARGRPRGRLAHPRRRRQRARLFDAAILLFEGTSVLDAALRAGFNDLTRFYVQFRRVLGTTPGQYAQRRNRQAAAAAAR